MKERFSKVSQPKFNRCFGISRPPTYSFCGYLRSTSICCGHEILQHLEKQSDYQTEFTFFLSLIILHSKGFCSFHVLWQLNNREVKIGYQYRYQYLEQVKRMRRQPVTSLSVVKTTEVASILEVFTPDFRSSC